MAGFTFEFISLLYYIYQKIEESNKKERRNMLVRILNIAIIIILIFVPGCKKGDESPVTTDEDNWQERIYFDQSLPDGTLEFTYLPADTSIFDYIIPLGNMNPPMHTIPTDHIYFVHDGKAVGKPVYAPASGKVLEIYTFNYGDGYDQRINIGVTKTSAYYMVHLVVDKNIKVGDFVSAGQKIGVVSPYAMAFDLGVVNRNVNQPFVNPKRYGYTSIYGDSPLKYFKEPYRSQLYSKVLREGPDKDGKFCYDQKGKLIGNWFAENTPSNPATISDYGKYQIAFAYDVFKPDMIRISIGGDFFPGVFFVQDEAIPPENVTKESGKITYYLFNNSFEFPSTRGQRVGLMIVQMLSDDKIKIEVFQDATSTTRNFTSNAKIYVR